MDKNRSLIIFLIISSTTFGQVKAKLDTSKFIASGKTEIGTIPDIAAVYPGGLKQMTKFINDNFVDKISISNAEAQSFQAPVAGWIIDEKGTVTDIKIIRTSNVPKIDKELINTIQKMPQWKPAQTMGQPVKSDFRFPLRICFK